MMQQLSTQDIASIDGADLHGSPGATRARARGLLEQALGWSLVDERRRRGWTQTQLADAVGASRETVSRWETSKTLPQVHHLVALVRWHAEPEAA